MNQLTFKSLVKTLKMKERLGKRQVKEEDIDTNVNPYQKAISNADSRDENKIEQMNNWSIFSDKIRYIDSCMNVTPILTIRPYRRLYSTLETQEDQTLEMIFEENKVKEASCKFLILFIFIYMTKGLHFL